jgi:hypothetical protein
MKKKVPLTFPLMILLIVIIMEFFIATLLYPTPYNFWEDDISDFGALYTPTGTPNTLFLILLFSIIMIFGTILSILYGFSIIRSHEHIFTGVLYFILAVGLSMIAIPTDLNHAMHRIGAIFGWISLWIIIIISLTLVARYYDSWKIKGSIIGLILVLCIINTTYLLFSFHVLDGNSSMWQKISFFVMGTVCIVAYAIQTRMHSTKSN